MITTILGKIFLFKNFCTIANNYKCRMGHVKRANGLMVHENCVYKGQGWQKFSKVNKRGVPFLGKNTEID